MSLQIPVAEEWRLDGAATVELCVRSSGYGAFHTADCAWRGLLPVSGIEQLWIGDVKCDVPPACRARLVWWQCSDRGDWGTDRGPVIHSAVQAHQEHPVTTLLVERRRWHRRQIAGVSRSGQSCADGWRWWAMLAMDAARVSQKTRAATD